MGSQVTIDFLNVEFDKKDASLNGCSIISVGDASRLSRKRFTYSIIHCVPSLAARAVSPNAAPLSTFVGHDQRLSEPALIVDCV